MPADAFHARPPFLLEVAIRCQGWNRRLVINFKFLHGKLYHIRKDGLDQAILGSSNFTVPGLGLKSSGNNVELNLIVDSMRDVADLRSWFDELWNDPTITSDVRDKILATNGCILADSVGLGKTFTALAVIKYFELKNERVLVLCPKKLRRNWMVYRSNDTLNPFDKDRFRYDVLSHTDLSRDKGDVDGIKFKNQQLKKLQHEVLDLEDLDDSPSLTSFSLDEFRLELLKFLETRRAELEEAPLGLYAVVPPPEKLAPPIRPGALFCLRRASQVDLKSSTGEKLNPLAPHFLVYIHDDGTVRFSFAQPKETLNFLRALAAGKTSAFAKLCAHFDSVTANGADMSHYADLIASALRAIEDTFQKRAAVNLLSDRDGLLPTIAESVTADQGDWELVTWLAIVNPS